MIKDIFICTLEQLRQTGSRGFSVLINGEQIDGFVVLKDDSCYAYRNSCPHTGSPLDWVEHQFLDLDKDYIQCSVHDARFDIEQGLCVSGPCPGDSLQTLTVKQHDGSIFLTL